MICTASSNSIVRAIQDLVKRPTTETAIRRKEWKTIALRYILLLPVGYDWDFLRMDHSFKLTQSFILRRRRSLRERGQSKTANQDASETQISREIV